MFFLLLIFLTVSSSFVQVSGIPVDLPQAHVEGSFRAEKFVVTIDAQSRIFFNDTPILGMVALKEELMKVPESSKGDAPTIIVRVDAKAPFDKVAQLMALAENVKLNAFLLTIPPQPEKNWRNTFVDTEK